VVLHGYRNLYEYAVSRLGFNIERQLLHTQVNAPGNLVQSWQFEIDTCAGHSLKLAETLYHHRFGGSD
jgi:hypothetical protein